MILSYRHNFLFMKGRKVAGTSIEIALSQLCGPEDIVTPIASVDELVRIAAGAVAQNYSDDPVREKRFVAELRACDGSAPQMIKPPSGRYWNHMTLHQLLATHGPLPTGMRLIALERSPYAKVLSLANMAATKGYTRTGVMHARPKAFRDAVPKLFESGDIRKVSNVNLYGGAARLGDYRFLRYERLEADFAALMDELGIVDPPALPHAKKGVMADALDPREHFTPAQLADINHLFKREFAFFGYEMVGSAGERLLLIPPPARRGKAGPEGAGPARRLRTG